MGSLGLEPISLGREPSELPNYSINPFVALIYKIAPDYIYSIAIYFAFAIELLLRGT